MPSSCVSMSVGLCEHMGAGDSAVTHVYLNKEDHDKAEQFR